MFGRRLSGAVAALALAALSLTLTGCDLEGTIDVRSEQEIVVDVSVSDSAEACLGLSSQSLASLKVAVDDAGGCRITGTLGQQNPAAELVTLSVVGENYVLDLNFPEGAGELPMDLFVTFPGQVVDGGGGRTDYNRVHFERGWGLGAVGKTRIVALNHPGPPWWVLAAGGGVLVGVLLTLALLLLLRRRRRAQAQLTGQVAELTPIVEAAAARAEDGDQDGLVNLTDPPDATWPAPQASDLMDQSAFWAPEEGDHPSQPVAVPIAHPPGPLAEPVDHSIWAPPEQD